MKPQTELHSVEDVPWTPIPAGATVAAGPGVVEKLLSVDPKNPDLVTRLCKLPAGYNHGGLTHPFWEEVYILKGTAINLSNNEEYKPGYYCCRHPGMPHGPFYIPEEYISLEIHYMPQKDR